MIWNYNLVETVSQKTLLGIRFWDPATDSQVHCGLNVVLYPMNNSRKKIYATCTLSGIYVFNRIPGMSDYESGFFDTEQIVSPIDRKEYILQVSDPERRFADIALQVNLPLLYDGLFLLGDDSGSPGAEHNGFNLYSSINRQAPAQYVFVRGELLDRNTELPAAYARVMIMTEDGFSWYAVSDEDGKFSVMMAYPYLNIPFGASPSAGDGVRLFERSWPITLSVYYEPLVQRTLNDQGPPDFLSVLEQDRAFIYIESPDTELGEVMDMQANLMYGRDLIVKTEGFSELYISSIGSPA